MIVQQGLKQLTDEEFTLLLPVIEDYFDSDFLVSPEDYISRIQEFTEDSTASYDQVIGTVPKFREQLDREDVEQQYQNLGLK